MNQDAIFIVIFLRIYIATVQLHINIIIPTMHGILTINYNYFCRHQDQMEITDTLTQRHWLLK
jgi:hypothetical protein